MLRHAVEPRVIECNVGGRGICSLRRIAHQRAPSCSAYRAFAGTARRAFLVQRTPGEGNHGFADVAAVSSSTSPAAKAASAEIISPPAIMLSASCVPTSLGRSWPAAGNDADLDLGQTQPASCAATRQWQPIASSSPPPSAVPKMAATLGWRFVRVCRRWSRSGVRCAVFPIR